MSTPESDTPVAQMKDAHEWQYAVLSEVQFTNPGNVRNVIRLIQADAMEHVLHLTLEITKKRDIFDVQRQLREEIVKLRNPQ